MHTSSG